MPHYSQRGACVLCRVDFDAQGSQHNEIVGHSQVIFAPAAGTGENKGTAAKSKAGKQHSRGRGWSMKLLMVLFPVLA